MRVMLFCSRGRGVGGGCEFLQCELAAPAGGWQRGSRRGLDGLRICSLCRCDAWQVAHWLMDRGLEVDSAQMRWNCPLAGRDHRRQRITH